MRKPPRLTTREQRVEEWFELPMIIVTLFLVITMAVPLLVPLASEWVQTFALLNLAIWCAFYIELFVKFYVAKSKLAALKRNWSLVVIVTAPLFLPLRLMRVSRLFGLIRFLRLQHSVARLKQRSRELIYATEYILLTIMMFVLSTGFIMWQVETRFDGSIVSLPDALWWALATITTVSYGDLSPTSVQGKGLAIVASLLGTTLLIIFIARVTALFLSSEEKMSAKKQAR